MSPLVSVLMTAYNREKYIAEAIESVLTQTFTDFELIIVDDRSGDKTHEITLAYAAKDPRIRVYRNEKNLGDYHNRNRAAELARGKYLKYVDSDDYIYTHGLQVMVDMIQRFPSAAVALGAPSDWVRPFPIELSPYDAYRRHYFEAPVLAKASLSAIILASAFRSVGGFSGKRWVGDFELWHTLAAHYSVLLIPDGLVYWRYHDEQEDYNNRTLPLVNFEYLLISIEQLSKPDCPLMALEKAKALRRVKWEQARMILRQIKSLRVHEAARLLRRLKLSLGKGST